MPYRFVFMLAKLKLNINLSPISIYLLTGLLGLLSSSLSMVLPHWSPQTYSVKKNCPSSKGAMLLSWRVPPLTPQGTKIFPPHPSRHFWVPWIFRVFLFWRTMTPCICFRSGCDLASGDEWDAGARSRQSCYINQLILWMEEILRQLIW